MACGLTLAVVGGIIGWAGAAVLREPEQVVQEASFAEVVAVQGTVSDIAATVVTASWPAEPVAVNQASGTITRVRVSLGDEVTAGEALYWVNERPTVVAEGKIPAFRTLKRDDSGRDVQQLTRLLKAKGFLTATSNRYSRTVEAAIKKWQQGIGTPATGVVEQGDVVYVSSLPMRVALDTEIVRVGAHLQGGEQVIKQLPKAPSFEAYYGGGLAKRVAEGMPIEVTDGERVWLGTLGQPQLGDDQQTVATVHGRDGESPCGQECGAVSFVGATQLQGTTQLQPEVSGVVVPVAALVANADGTPAVVAPDGARTTVTIRATARGMAVVGGLEAGTVVRVPGQ